MHHLIHGTTGLGLAYTLALTGVIVALVQERAPLVRSGILCLPVAALAILPAGIAAALAAVPIRLLSLIGIPQGLVGLLQVLCGAFIVVAFGYAAGLLLARVRGDLGSLHRRGAVLGFPSGAGATRVAARTAPAPDGVTIAGVAIACADETKHFKIIGTTGTGKSTGIREILRGALARGDRVVIGDPDGGYLERFHDVGRGDVILSPFWSGACKWDPFMEICAPQDIEQLARALIADGSEGRMWQEYARTFFSELLRRCMERGVGDDRTLHHLVTSASREELREMLAGTPAGPFLEEGNERMFGSIRSVASSSLKAFAHTSKQEGPRFGVRSWVRKGAAAGRPGSVLFLPYRAGEIESMRTMISAWMRLAMFQVMDAPEGDQRIWFMLDELDALGAIDGLKDALARLRKFGGRCVLGFQSIGQVSDTYGAGTAHTIVENCANTLVLRCSASERGGTSEFASRLIGQREVVHRVRSYGSRLWPFHRSSSEHIQIEPAVLAAEIERLPDLEGFLKAAANPDWMSVRLTPDPPAPHTSTPAPVDGLRAADVPAPPVMAEAPAAASPAGGTAPPAGGAGSSRRARAPRARTRKAASSADGARVPAAQRDDGASSSDAQATARSGMANPASPDEPALSATPVRQTGTASTTRDGHVPMEGAQAGTTELEEE
jgi:hypothetical protein